MKRLLAVAMATLLVGCATVGVEEVEKLKAGTTIVPFSLLGDSMPIQYVGLTVFQNERRDLNVADWRIDRYVESAAARQIGAGAKFQAKIASTDEARNTAGKFGQGLWDSKPVVQGGPEAIIRLAKDWGGRLHPGDGTRGDRRLPGNEPAHLGLRHLRAIIARPAARIQLRDHANASDGWKDRRGIGQHSQLRVCPPDTCGVDGQR